MQEMDQGHVNFYLKMFDEFLNYSGITYLCNRRDHYFKGQYKFPKSWKLIIKTESPRSFIRDFPIEIYQKQKNKVSQNINNLISKLYDYRLDSKNWKILTQAKKKYKLY